MDGKRCPMKAAENEDREFKRQQNLMEARTYKTKDRRDKAEEKYKMCIKIRDNFTKAVMNEVAKQFSHDKRVYFVWSPYEADAQLAQLCIDRRVDAVVTEVRFAGLDELSCLIFLLFYYLAFFSHFAVVAGIGP